MNTTMADQSRPVTGYPAPPSYPYAAAPPSYYPHAPPPYPPRAAFRRRLISAIIVSFVMASTFVFIAWIVLRPQPPEIHADSLSLSSFNLSSPPSSSLLTATWLLRLTVRNPNRKTELRYDRIEASVYYQSEPLSQTTLAPFVQPRKNQTTASATFVTEGAYVDGKAGEGMSKERREKGSVEFNVRMLARVRYKAGAWRARPRFLRVYCKGLQVAFTGNSGVGSMAGGPRKCRVGL